MADLWKPWSLWARPLVLSINLLLCFGTSRQASAQDAQQNALARSLFEEGVVLSDAGEYEAAADRFSRAYSLRPTSGIAFNWASVLIEAGKLLQAQDLLMSVTRDPAADAQLQASSSTLLRTLAPRVPRLRVHVSGEVDESLHVQVDRTEWPRAAWDIASPINPGPHTLLLLRGNDALTQQDVQLSEGEARDVTLQVPGEPQAKEALVFASPLAQAPATDEQPAARKPLYKSWVVWTAVGAVVVAGVVTGVVLGTRGEAKDQPPVQGNANPGVLTW